LGADVKLKRNHWRKVMTDKFKKVPVDGDTRILSSEERKIGDYDVLIQLWSWDGIMGGSVIFANEDIAGLDEDKIMELVKKSEFVNEDASINANKSDSGYTFFNFPRPDLED
jgi:hypothetical protein